MLEYRTWEKYRLIQNTLTLNLIPHLPTITALVLNYKTPNNTVACVRALKKQTIADEIDILVIDNHSEDDSIGIIRNRLKDIPHVQILESGTNLGYGQGNEIGIKRATTPYVLVINPDNELTGNALELMIAEMKKDASIGIIAPQLIHEDGTIRDSARAFPTFFDAIIKRTFLSAVFPMRMDRYLERSADPNQERDVDWVVGACMLIRRDLLETIGGFDPRFFLFFEDMDLCRRCWNAGLKVRYFPKAVASDRKRRLSEGGMISVLFHKTGRIHIVSALRYFQKWRKDRSIA